MAEPLHQSLLDLAREVAAEAFVMAARMRAEGVDVADCPGVRSPAGGLELVDELHGPHLRRPAHRAGGEGRGEHVGGVEAALELPFDLRHQGSGRSSVP